MITRFREALARRKAKPRRGTGRNAATNDDVVAIEYSPHIDGDPDPGEIVWTWVPYEEDPTQGKDRPVVVIGRRRDRLVAVPLTTKPDDREPQVAVGTGSWDSDRRVSYARIERMLDIDPDVVRREGSIVEPDTFAAVVKAVDELYDVRYPRH
jgi:hypothetical protein